MVPIGSRDMSGVHVEIQFQEGYIVYAYASLTPDERDAVLRPWRGRAASPPTKDGAAGVAMALRALAIAIERQVTS